MRRDNSVSTCSRQTEDLGVLAGVTHSDLLSWKSGHCRDVNRLRDRVESRYGFYTSGSTSNSRFRMFTRATKKGISGRATGGQSADQGRVEPESPPASAGRTFPPADLSCFMIRGWARADLYGSAKTPF